MFIRAEQFLNTYLFYLKEPQTPAQHTGAGSCPSCVTSHPAPRLQPRRAAEGGSGAWRNHKPLLTRWVILCCGGEGDNRGAEATPGAIMNVYVGMEDMGVRTAHCPGQLAFPVRRK